MRNLPLLYQKIRRAWRNLGRKQRQAVGLATACIIIFLIILQGTKPMIDPAAYQPLLEVIAKGESNGNYNAYFGHPGNNELRLTDMTVAEITHWQEEYVRQGNPSNAVGRYQFMGTTLAGLVKQLRISPQTIFDQKLQDRLAITLIERRGSLAFVQGKITREQFAANLAMEWAALPRVIGGNPSESYYAEDGLNQARVSAGDVLEAIDKVKSY